MEGDDEFKRTEWEIEMSRFIRVMADTKNHLLKLDGDTKMEVLRVLINIPKLDEADVYNLTTMALQNKSNSSIPRDDVEGVCGVSVGGEREERLPRDESLNDPPRLTQEAETQMREEVANLVNPTKIRFTMKKRSVPDSESHYEEEVRAKKKVNTKTNVVLSNQPAELPQNFQEYIRNLNGSEAVLVIEKQLYYSDVNKDSGRLSMPLNQVMLTDFLSQGEMELLHNYREIKAKILSEPPDQKEFMEQDICLIMWKMEKGPDQKKAKKANYTCNLRSGWNDVRKKNNLCKNMVVQMWSFHVGEQLWFALVTV
ncbi:B3 domain-containing protein At2g31720-like [Actinidia eriantha]|uniref:B3 domain-containing protein At2g31720-like n=1 Tax=Actinidia eriantha TaxID=165200 RepID=UPI0025870AF5|nr:B3 domain-containing protein At2g31720-like [Actinidia eriantha]